MKSIKEWSGKNNVTDLAGNVKSSVEQLKSTAAQVTDPIVKRKLESIINILSRKVELLNQKSSLDGDDYVKSPSMSNIMSTDRMEENKTNMNKNQKIKLLTEIVKREAVKIIEEAKKKAKKKKRKLKIEGTTVESIGSVLENELGNFWVVTAPTNESNDKNICFETDVFNLAEKIQNGLSRESVRAIVSKEGKARQLGKKYLKERGMQVQDATKKAEGLKNLRDEVRGQVETIRKNKQETVQAVNKLREGRKVFSRK